MRVVVATSADVHYALLYMQILYMNTLQLHIDGLQHRLPHANTEKA